MEKIEQESRRVVNIANNAESILDDLDKQFEKQTGLDNTDVTFLFLQQHYK